MRDFCQICGKRNRTHNGKHFKIKTCSLACRDVLRAKNKRSQKLPPPIRGARWIPLTLGRCALVDADCYEELLGAGPWAYCKAPRGQNGYAGRRRTRGGVKETIVFMHRLVLKLKKGQESDHRNGNGLDNRRRNLRIATKKQNNRNRAKHSNRVRTLASKFKGVYRPTESALPWGAHITIDDVTKHIGQFSTELEAARVYDEAARAAFGRFACTNFPRGKERPALVKDPHSVWDLVE
jgi:hypothetical protein